MYILNDNEVVETRKNQDSIIIQGCIVSQKGGKFSGMSYFGLYTNSVVFLCTISIPYEEIYKMQTFETFCYVINNGHASDSRWAFVLGKKSF